MFRKRFQQNRNRSWNEVLYIKKDSAILPLLSQIGTKKVKFNYILLQKTNLKIQLKKLCSVLFGVSLILSHV